MSPELFDSRAKAPPAKKSERAMWRRMRSTQPDIKHGRQVHLEIRFNIRTVLLDFQSFTENTK